jgi:hypothetical protein
MGRLIEVFNLQALAFQAGRDTVQATATLQRAICHAEPQGYTRILLDEGTPIALPLGQVAAGGILRDYTRRLMTAFAEET